VIIYDTYDPQPKYSKLAKPLHITTAKGSGFRGIIKQERLRRSLSKKHPNLKIPKQQFSFNDCSHPFYYFTLKF
jgi:hypothetical protein